jgi:hypothetical protein
MSYNPQQPLPQEPASERVNSGSGAGYYGNGNPQNPNQNPNQYYANVPPQQPPFTPAPTGTHGSAGTPPYNSPSNPKKALPVNPALAIGGGVALLAVIALVIFLVLKPGANGNAGNGTSPTFGKTTLTGKVGEVLRLDDYAVTVHTVKWNNVPANYQIKINGETRLAKPDEGFVAIEFSIQRVSSTGIASRSPYGVSTSSQYSVVDGSGRKYESYGHPNPAFPDIKSKDRMDEGEILRGWETYAAPKALATDPNFTFVIETPPYAVNDNGVRSGSSNVAKSPFYFKFKLAQ